MTRKWLDNLFVKIFTSDETHFDSWSSRKIKKHPNVLKYFETRYEYSSSIMETLWRMKFHIEDRPKCPMCGKYTQFRGRPNQIFLKFCSIKCSVNSEDTKNKFKETSLNKYGVDNPFKSPIVKEKWKKTNKERFGVEYPSQNQAIKQKMFDAMMSTKVKEHIHNVKKKHNSFNTSIPEEKLNDLLVEKYGKDDVFRQFISKEYPWHCDFYIKSIDTFIELQGMWTHGGHPYNPNSIEDQTKLQRWQSKVNNGSRFYKSAIKVWTQSDVDKRETAIKNNLKYIEVFDSKDFEILYNLSIL